MNGQTMKLIGKIISTFCIGFAMVEFTSGAFANDDALPEHAHGSLECLFGPMCSGKSSYLLRTAESLQDKGITPVVLTGSAHNGGNISSRAPGDESIPAVMVSDGTNVDELEDALEENAWVVVDESQFLVKEHINALFRFVNNGGHVIFAGLLHDSDGHVWPTTQYILVNMIQLDPGTNLAVWYCFAECYVRGCDKSATHTARYDEGKRYFNPPGESSVCIGTTMFEAVCSNHFKCDLRAKKAPEEIAAFGMCRYHIEMHNQKTWEQEVNALISMA
ncbi:MAG: hypothetical protein LBT03_00750 [Holosporales bacterium]|jgi:thymidine kinase|nr:hypothetical protein [Holosporales bacterium]